MILRRISMIAAVFALMFLASCASTKTFPSPYLLQLQDGGFMRTDITKDWKTKSICRLTPDNRQLWCHDLINGSRSEYTQHESVAAMAQDYAGGAVCAGSFINQRKNLKGESQYFSPLVAHMDRDGQWLWYQRLELLGCFRVAGVFQSGDVVAAGAKVISNIGLRRKAIAAWYGSKGDLQRYLEFDEAEEITAMIILPDKTTAFFGSERRKGITGNDFKRYFAHVSSSGQILRQHTVQIGDSCLDLRHAILAHDGGFVVVGADVLAHAVIVAKLSPEGALVWQKIMQPDSNPGFFSVGPVVTAIAQQVDGRILVIGDIRESEVCGFAACLDSAGNLQWQIPMLMENRPCRFQAIRPNADGTFTLFGANENKEEISETLHAAIITSEGRLEPLRQEASGDGAD